MVACNWLQLIHMLDMAQERNNKFVIATDAHQIAYADDDRLTQILMNITKNSIQFTKNGTITLSAYTEAQQTVIQIQDTGIGMNPEEIENIWKRFYKAIDSRTTNPYGEFGLGLSIVKQLVLLHDGTITVDSQKGQGTTFTIRLPLQDKNCE